MRSLPAALLCALALAHPANARDAPEQRTIRVLFVGNSYTYTNDLPTAVATVAAARGVLVAPGMLAEPNFALEDHIVTGAYDRALASADWDWVVLQQGPSSLPQNRANLREWAGRAARSAGERGIQVALFAAWPALENFETSLDAELSYRLAAMAVHGCALPVATAWRMERTSIPELDLYQRDRLHPVTEGTLLAALVMVRGMFAQVPQHGPPDLGAVIVDEADWRHAFARVAVLDAIAETAVAAETARCAFAKGSGPGATTSPRSSPLTQPSSAPSRADR